ncbi:MAG: SAF domain-containing protein [Nocardioides sp.]
MLTKRSPGGQVMAHEVTRGRLPVTRRDRRPMLAALALLLILLGALGSALIAFRSGDRVSVLAARRDIEIGTEVSAADFTEIRAAADTPGVIEARFLDNFVGSRAVGFIPTGTIANKEMFTTLDGIPRNAELVGITLDPTRRPGRVPRAGQVVRVFFVTGEEVAADGTEFAGGDAVVPAARVVSVETGADADSVNLTLLVSEKNAGTVANYASSGNLAVSLLADETEPAVDLEEPADAAGSGG